MKKLKKLKTHHDGRSLGYLLGVYDLSPYLCNYKMSIKDLQLRQFSEACKAALLFSEKNHCTKLKAAGFSLLLDSPYDVVYKYDTAETLSLFVGQTNFNQCEDICAAVELITKGDSNYLPFVRHKIEELVKKSHVKHVFLQGFSLGGACALELAGELNKSLAQVKSYAFAVAPIKSRASKEALKELTFNHALISYQDIVHHADILDISCKYYEAQHIYRVVEKGIFKVNWLDNLIDGSFVGRILERPKLSVHNPKYYLDIVEHVRKIKRRNLGINC